MKYIITSTTDRLPSGICLTIEMPAFFLICAWVEEIDDALIILTFIQIYTFSLT
jgi:hypothetical protein